MNSGKGDRPKIARPSFQIHGERGSVPANVAKYVDDLTEHLRSSSSEVGGFLRRGASPSKIKQEKKFTKRELVVWLLQVIRDMEVKRELMRLERGQFYSSAPWKELRYRVLKASDGRCALCGVSASSGAVLHVDHIKPRSLFPELALEESNMQVLCADCNVGKSNKDDTDWRAEVIEAAAQKL